MLPQPEKPIPIWIGGSSEPALKRALRLDGWHGSRVSPEAGGADRHAGCAPSGRSRNSRSRCATAGTARTRARSRARLAAYGEAGVGHVLVEPAERELDDWLRAVERRSAKARRTAVRSAEHWRRTMKRHDLSGARPTMPASTWIWCGRPSGSATRRCGAARPMAPTRSRRSPGCWRRPTGSRPAPASCRCRRARPPARR